MAIACSSDKMFVRLSGAMGRPEMATDDNYATTAARIERRSEVNGIVTDWTSRMTRVEVQTICDKFDVPCGPVNSIADIFEDPQYAARKNLLSVTSERAGEVVIPGILPVLSETPGAFSHVGPAFGEHTAEIYAELLGLSGSEIDRLRQKKVI